MSQRGPSPGRVTAREVAELAGVSISAVSRVFTEGASVSAATRRKVVDATRFLGYQPNLLARSLMTKRTELIGLISNNFDNPAYMEIFDLFTRRLQQRGYARWWPTCRTVCRRTELCLFSCNIAWMVSSFPPRPSTASSLKHVLTRACRWCRPLVAHGTKSPINVVGADNIQGGRVAGDLLRDRGYRRMAFLGGPRAATSTEDRLKGFRTRLREDGLQPVAEVYGHSFSYNAGNTLMRELLGGGESMQSSAATIFLPWARSTLAERPESHSRRNRHRRLRRYADGSLGRLQSHNRPPTDR